MDFHHHILPYLALFLVELLCLSFEAGDSYHGGHHQHQGKHTEHHQGNIPNRRRKTEERQYDGRIPICYFCQGAALLVCAIIH